jgi:hypothetical protein
MRFFVSARGRHSYVEDFILSAGVKNVSIKATEDEMHRNEKAQFTNTTTPFAAVELLAKFLKKRLLPANTAIFCGMQWRRHRPGRTGFADSFLLRLSLRTRRDRRQFRQRYNVRF